MIKTNVRSYILVAVVALLAIAIYLINSQSVERSSLVNPVTLAPRALEQAGTQQKDASAARREKAQKYELAKEITTPDGFINTPLTSSGQAASITIGEFIGKKVILVDFWTYSCINCQRTTPYLNAWYEKYKDKGLVIIGMHTPEFEFEKDYGNVKTAVEKFGIKYPVVLDNDYSTWTAYKNRYWPRKYLIDIDGYIIYDHIGEGAYEETERHIQRALAERMAVLGENEVIAESLTTETLVSGEPRSPEIYFGAARNEHLGNGKPGMTGVQNFAEPAGPEPNTLYLAGSWNVQDEFAENKSKEAKIIFRYQAKEVFFVAGSERGVTVGIKKDGGLIKEEIVKAHTLYRLIQDAEPGKHTLEIIIKDPGLRAFTFTFG